MKFSRSLQFSRAGEWDGEYLNYDELKQTVHKIAANVATGKNTISNGSELSTLEGSFMSLFKEELARVGKFYASQRKSIHKTISDIKKSSVLEDRPGSPMEAKVAEANYCQLVDLKSFLDTNRVAFKKVLSSHDKYSKTLIEAQMQMLIDQHLPHADSETLADEIEDSESNYARYYCLGDGETAHAKLAAFLEERRSQRSALAWKAIAAGAGARAKEGPTIVEIASSNDAVAQGTPVKGAGATAPPVVGHKSKPMVQLLQLLALAAIFGVILLWQPMKDSAMDKCLAMCVLAIGLWITEAVPLYVTGLMIPLLVVVLKLQLKDQVTRVPLEAIPAAKLVVSKMFSKVTLMLIGGFSIAAATTKYGVARQIAVQLLKMSGESIGLLIALVMVLSQLIAMFISNVTAPVLLFTLLSPLLQAINPENPLGRQLILAVAISGNLGGAISPIASPQNVIAISEIGEISWGQWLGICVPFCGVSTLLCWLIIMGRPSSNKPFNASSYFPSTSFRWGPKELTVVLTILGTIALWAIPPKSSLNVFGDGGIIAIFPVLVFFGTGMLGKDEFNSFPWTVVMLAIGGAIMGDSLDGTGLLKMVASKMSIITRSSQFVQYSVVTLFVTIATCFISHTVGALILLPIVKLVTGGSRMVMMGTALACSAGMALPVSSFPNMSAAAQEDNLGRPFLTSAMFIQYGAICSLLAWVAIVAIGYPLMVLFL